MKKPKLKDKFFVITAAGKIGGTFEVVRTGAKTFRLSDGTTYMQDNGRCLQGGSIRNTSANAFEFTEELQHRKTRQDAIIKVMNSKTNLIAVLASMDFMPLVHLSNDEMEEFANSCRALRTKALTMFDKKTNKD